MRAWSAGVTPGPRRAGRHVPEGEEPRTLSRVVREASPAEYEPPTKELEGHDARVFTRRRSAHQGSSTVVAVPTRESSARMLSTKARQSVYARTFTTGSEPAPGDSTRTAFWARLTRRRSSSSGNSGRRRPKSAGTQADIVWPSWVRHDSGPPSARQSARAASNALLAVRPNPPPPRCRSARCRFRVFVGRVAGSGLST